jgi:hypothetical protein
MRHWWTFVTVIALMAVGVLNGCDLGWDFLKEGGGGSAGAQGDCQGSRVVIGQFPPSGNFFATGTFTAEYSSPKFTGLIPSQPLFALRVSRNRLWLNDLSIEVSFFPFDNTTEDLRNGCLGRALLEINIPKEDLFFGTPIEIRSTRPSQTEPSAFYAEGGDPGFTSSAVQATIQLQSTDEGDSMVTGTFELTFNPGNDQRTFINGQVDADVDQNPAAEGLQSS